MAHTSRPLIRISSNGRSPRTSVEVVTADGALDVSGMVTRASWSVSAGDLAHVTLDVGEGALDVLGDLTDVRVEQPVDEGPVEVLRSLALAPAGRPA